MTPQTLYKCGGRCSDPSRSVTSLTTRYGSGVLDNLRPARRRQKIHSRKPTTGTQSSHLQELVPSHLTKILLDHVILEERQSFASKLMRASSTRKSGLTNDSNTLRFHTDFPPSFFILFAGEFSMLSWRQIKAKCYTLHRANKSYLLKGKSRGARSLLIPKFTSLKFIFWPKDASNETPA